MTDGSEVKGRVVEYRVFRNERATVYRLWRTIVSDQPNYFMLVMDNVGNLNTCYEVGQWKGKYHDVKIKIRKKIDTLWKDRQYVPTT